MKRPSISCVFRGGACALPCPWLRADNGAMIGAAGWRRFVADCGATGRRSAESIADRIEISGDESLGRRVVDNLNMMI